MWCKGNARFSNKCNLVDVMLYVTKCLVTSKSFVIKEVFIGINHYKLVPWRGLVFFMWVLSRPKSTILWSIWSSKLKMSLASHHENYIPHQKEYFQNSFIKKVCILQSSGSNVLTIVILYRCNFNFSCRMCSNENQCWYTWCLVQCRELWRTNLLILSTFSKIEAVKWTTSWFSLHLCVIISPMHNIKL